MSTTMHHDRVRVTLADHGVGEVALARPDKMNALDPAMFRGIVDAIKQLQAEQSLRAVVLHGEGRAFCAGLDKGSFEAILQGDKGFSDLMARTHGLANLFQQVAWGWRELPVPVIAAVQGAAYGGGLQVALGADMRYARADARFSVMEIQWGLVPDMAGAVFLAELVRPDIARELTFTGRVVEGTEAAAIGLATRLCEDPLTEARKAAAAIAARSPDAIRAGKRLLGGASPVRAAEVLLAESREQAALIGAPNQLEAVRAGLESRAPRFL
jgi:enoyl-CoA hydratase/carnithine racemase